MNCYLFFCPPLRYTHRTEQKEKKTKSALRSLAYRETTVCVSHACKSTIMAEFRYVPELHHFNNQSIMHAVVAFFYLKKKLKQRKTIKTKINAISHHPTKRYSVSLCILAEQKKIFIVFCFTSSPS